MRTGSFVVISVVLVVTMSFLVVAAMYASSVVGDEEKNGGLWCSPIANTSMPTSSVFCAILTTASIRSASLGVWSVVGSRVISLTEKIPNCTSRLQIYAFAWIYNATEGAVFPGGAGSPPGNRLQRREVYSAEDSRRVRTASARV